jgi:uncharacterized protein (DUF983 family)
MFGRALLLRCPRCGGRGILRGWLKMRDVCPTCGLALERGEASDFWLGAYVFNLAGAEGLSILLVVIYLIVAWPNVNTTIVEAVAIALAVSTPFLFFPFSRTLWLAWDLSFRPSEPGDERR